MLLTEIQKKSTRNLSRLAWQVSSAAVVSNDTVRTRSGVSGIRVTTVAFMCEQEVRGCVFCEEATDFGFLWSETNWQSLQSRDKWQNCQSHEAMRPWQENLAKL